MRLSSAHVHGTCRSSISFRFLANSAAAISAALCASRAAFAQGTSTLISGNPSSYASGGFGNCAITHDGRWVAFASTASDIVPGDTNGVFDVYLRDASSNTTTRVSVSDAGTQFNFASRNPALSATGRWIVFYTAPNKVLVRDLWNSVNDNVHVDSNEVLGDDSPQDDFAFAITPDGRFVAFASYATNLVSGDTNGKADLFVRDRAAGTTELVSVGLGGVPADGYSVKACLSDDGRFVAFESYATNLVPLDSNFWGDCFLRDRLLGTTERVSVSSSGVQAHLGAKKPSMSVDGRFIAFESQSSNLVLGDFDGVDDVFVRDRATGVTELVSKTTAGVAVGGDAPSISADGRFVSFVSSSPQLIPHDLNNHADVFVVDRLTGAAHVAGRDAGGDLGDGDARQPALSGDGRWVAFGSLATNFAPNDNNNLLDYFVHDVAPTVPIAYCTAKPNSAGCTPSIAASGIASVSLAPPQFWVHGQNVLNQKVGYLFYGLGIGNWPYMGGTLCVSVPVRRTPGVNSGGNAAPPTDCSGLLSFDFNSWIRSGVDPTLVPGTVVDVQWAYRDPADPHKIGFTDALQFVISD